MTYIEKLFNVRRDEVPRLMVFVTMMFFFIIGTVWAQITIIAQFVSDNGLENVPYLLIGDAIIIAITFAVYSSYADRFANNHIMIGLNVIGIMGILVGFGLLLWGSNLAYWVLYLVFRSITEAISVHWGPFINDYYDTRAAKRIFALLGGVVRLSNIIAALSLSVLNEYVGIFGGIGVWITTLLVMMGVNIVAFSASSRQPILLPGQQKTEANYIQRMREGYEFVLGSRYLRLFALASLLMMVLMAAMQFRILAILDNVYADAPNKDEPIRQFLSNVTLFGSLLILPFQLFFFNRLVSRVGVENTNLIFPTTSLFTALGLVFPTIWMAAAGEFNRTILNLGVRAVNDEFMYNAVPMRVKGRTRGFMSGIVQPAGTLLGGFLAALPFLAVFPWFMPFVLVVFGIAYLLVSVAVSREYGRALVSMIQQENFSFLLDADNRLMIDSETARSLENRLHNADNDDTRLLVGRLLIEARNTQYVPMLASYARNGSPYLRAGIIDAFVSADVRNEQVLDLCMSYVDDPHLEVQRSAVTGLKQLAGAGSEKYLLAASKVLNAPDTKLIAEVLPDLVNAHDFYFVRYATQTLNELLESEDEQKRAIGVEIVGRTRSQRIVLLLMRYLIDRSQVVRLQAAIAIERLLIQSPPIEEVRKALTVAVSSLLRDPVDRIRLAAVRILEQLDADNLAQRMQPALLDTNLEVRETAVTILTRYPEESESVYRPLLRSNDRLLRRMAAVVLVRIKPDDVSLVMDNIHVLLRDTYENIVYMVALIDLDYIPSIVALRSVLQEENDHNIREVFYMLGSVYGREAVHVTEEALRSSAARTRANAVEALDVMLPQRLLNSLVYLTEPEQSMEQLAQHGVQLYDIRQVDAAAVLRNLAHRKPSSWEQYVTVTSLGEIGRHAREQLAAVKRQSPLDLLAGGDTRPQLDDGAADSPLTVAEIEMLLNDINAKPRDELYAIVHNARDMVRGVTSTVERASRQANITTIERVILLKRVGFFQHVTIEQLAKVAEVCREVFYEEDQTIFSAGDTGGKLYVIVQGRVGIEQVSKYGQSARLNTLGAEAFFGEDTLFDQGKLTTTALALMPTMLLELRYEALLALIQAYPDMSLRVMEALSQQIRSANQRLITLKRTDTGAGELFDMLDV